MPFYSIRNNKLEDAGVVAKNLDEALIKFGDKFKEKLSLEGEGAPEYMLDEWDENDNPHWVSHHIPVYANSEAV